MPTGAFFCFPRPFPARDLVLISARFCVKIADINTSRTSDRDRSKPMRKALFLLMTELSSRKWISRLAGKIAKASFSRRWRCRNKAGNLSGRRPGFGCHGAKKLHLSSGTRGAGQRPCGSLPPYGKLRREPRASDQTEMLFVKPYRRKRTAGHRNGKAAGLGPPA